jgi:hypothetical protein
MQPSGKNFCFQVLEFAEKQLAEKKITKTFNIWSYNYYKACA